jgi:hypothetical protein
MPSPFPGMDPYIEACGLWGDFHDSLVAEIKRALAPRLPDRYVVRTNARSYIVLVDTDEKKQHLFLPDVSVEAPRKEGRRPGRPKGGAVATLARGADESLSIRAFIEDRHREAFLEIFEATTTEHRLVTSIEVLSPSNTRPGTTGREEYLRKRQSCLLGETNFVEIDLLRGGERMPMLEPWPNSPYVIFVARSFSAGYGRVWPAYFQKRLPVAPVPLCEPDAPVPIDLQAAVDAAYAISRYDRNIDYRQPLIPPLAAEDAAWLAGRLREQKRTRAKRS